MTASCIYEGWVRHRRYEPTAHAFRFHLCMMYLDLAELTHVFDCHPLWSVEGRGVANFRRKDHQGNPGEDISQSIRGLVVQQAGSNPEGPIRLLTHPAYFGYCFNPVSLYFCFDSDDRFVETVVAEVNNTPWGERHCYVLTESMNEGDGRRHRYRFDKRFHVSPYMDMKQIYDWRLTEPTESLTMHTDNIENGRTHFDSTMVLHRREISRSSLSRVLVRYPVMTAQVIGAIYWQAFRLWIKGTPSFVHPAKRVRTLGEPI